MLKKVQCDRNLSLLIYSLQVFGVCACKALFYILVSNLLFVCILPKNHALVERSPPGTPQDEQT